jgi:tRNA1Val (adenine37-N6)-methyltransferase
VKKKNSIFHFKQFSIEDSKSAMKVGTDAVLLGAWVNLKGVKRILDVGTGCGIIALMLAQRTDEKVNNVHIEGIDADEQSAKQAEENLLETRWCNRVLMHHYPLQTFRSEFKYDLIISNPPYFINSQLPPKAHRAKARHTDSLSYKELLHHSVRLLKTKGRLAVILPYEEGKLFLALAKEVGLHLHRQLSFYSRKEKPQERWLFEFSFNLSPTKNEQLILHGEGESWSEEYKELTKEFYLKL